MKRKHLLISLLLSSILFTSCASDYYVLNKYRNLALPTLVGYRGDNPLTVSLIADDAVLIEENSRTAIREFDVTQYDKSFILRKISGHYFKLTERSSPLEKDTSIGLHFIFDNNGAKVFDNSTFISSNSEIKLEENKDYIFRITQDGDFTTLLINCDTLLHRKTKIPASEYTIFKTGDDTEVEIYSFEVEELEEKSFF